jgi:hypothetical protein
MMQSKSSMKSVKRKPRDPRRQVSGGRLLVVSVGLCVLLYSGWSAWFNVNNYAWVAIPKPQQYFPLKNALVRIKARNAYLGTKNTDISVWKTGGTPAFHKASSTSGPNVALLSPVYDCPWTLHRTNFVSESQFDGGKWTCGVQEMQGCIVYSFGSNNDDFFERDVRLQNPRCEIHIFDPTSGTPPVEWKELGYHFHPSGLCVGSQTSFTASKQQYPCKSLQGHMNDLGHDHVDIVKADVEGMEWDLVSQWPLEETRIGQLLLEFHFWKTSPFLPDLLRKYIIPLERAGYFLHTLEPVAAMHPSYEITFLNVNWSPDGIDRKIFDASMYPSTPGIDNSWNA